MDDPDELEPTVAMPHILPPQQLPTPHPVEDAAVPVEAVPVAVTPVAPVESVAPAYVFGNPFAYMFRRFFAFAFDLVLVTAVSTTIMYGVIAINPLTGLPTNSEGGFDATFGIGLAIALLYVLVFEAFLGTTLGKLAFSLHIYTRKSRLVGLGRAFVRNLMRPIDMFVIGGILALLPGHRRLGDLLGGTVVARSPLRGFSPLIGWIGIIMLAALPFLIAGGPVTVLAAGAAFLEFIPHLFTHAFDLIMQLFGGGMPHPPPPATTTG
jgi:uncharacterized RDD family membrane protein YckC